MVWLTENWFWILIFIAFIAMHLFGHGGHGSVDKENSAKQSSAVKTKSGGHRH
ncbi:MULTISPECIES: DUF2933 domain-containing protein [Pseudomonas]|jgi:hypothetical protein|uniref:DUF2933 domain-containing protein n=1 Tax=Pseudomonas TaxID=286 RepID=UPI0009B83362|nr:MULTISPECIES: DUF2933 domain-containing protein [Pseudomonas]MBX9755407.1 DUF2933 domain-containing protein [Pseudomonadaceae bacterium]KAA0946271.1 DUF2933 domain-containing protein [Pseudomonas sp. ANT_H4]KAA0946456.1 DUF2933 domain-containing protein [Pseudomonas sp. ANT_H14]NMX42352.1 DUF2933 domain-containing protein [Pseudomonas veronii]NMY29359.1 DUF2933 domain-containing protein [Pseudomonas sp. WS 5021]